MYTCGDVGVVVVVAAMDAGRPCLLSMYRTTPNALLGIAATLDVECARWVRCCGGRCNVVFGSAFYITIHAFYSLHFQHRCCWGFVRLRVNGRKCSDYSVLCGATDTRRVSHTARCTVANTRTTYERDGQHARRKRHVEQLCSAQKSTLRVASVAVRSRASLLSGANAKTTPYTGSQHAHTHTHAHGRHDTKGRSDALFC